MDVAELAPGLWRWTAPHPEWTPEEDWPRDVGCVYWEGGDAVCLVDPLVPAGEEERFWRHLDADVERARLPVAVLVTIGFHERSAAAVAARYGARVLRPPLAGADLPAGIRAFDPEREGGPSSPERGEAVLWLEPPRALVAGDVLLGEPLRVCPWFDTAAGRRHSLEALRPLLELPVELVVPSHGAPVTAGARDALARALA